MRITGLCGGIGAGKSTVAALFGVQGAHVIDVDLVGRRVLEPGGRAYGAVIELFGKRVLAAESSAVSSLDGSRAIDRAVLAEIVFSDPAELARLESVSHPAINAELDELLALAAAEGRDWVVLDMAVLVESTLGRDLPSGRGYDRVVVVEAPEPVRVARLVETRGMDPGDAAGRIASQADDATRRAVADVVIENDGDLDALAAAVAATIPELTGPLPDRS